MSAKYDIGDYNRGGYWTFVYSMGVTMVFFIYIAFVHPGVDLNELQGMESQQESEMMSAEKTEDLAEEKAEDLKHDEEAADSAESN